MSMVRTLGSTTCVCVCLCVWSGGVGEKVPHRHWKFPSLETWELESISHRFPICDPQTFESPEKQLNARHHANISPNPGSGSSGISSALCRKRLYDLISLSSSGWGAGRGVAMQPSTFAALPGLLEASALCLARAFDHLGPRV